MEGFLCGAGSAAERRSDRRLWEQQQQQQQHYQLELVGLGRRQRVLDVELVFSVDGSNAKVVALVPSAVKSKGTMTVASDATYAPNEFIASDGKP